MDNDICIFLGLHVEVVMGGLPVAEDIKKFKDNKVQIVVGSPGRLKHLIDAGHLNISTVRLLVLDEADKLMEKSFLPDIQYIYSALPQDKQVILSSATYPESCKEFINEFVQGAQHVCPNSDCVLLGVDQKVTHVKFNSNSVLQTTNRFKELLKIITTKQFKQCLIFCNYRARVEEVHKMLMKAKWPAEQLHGTQDQGDRLDALKTLQEYKCRILITTDVAARGIDASNVDLVINFEPPFEWQTYLHRIGRAGRFGSYGTAITILSKGEEEKKFMNLLTAVNLSINLTPLWTDAEIVVEKTLVSKDQDHPQLNGSNGHNSSELWKIICGEKNSSDSKNIEDFHELINSFQNSKTNKIESFSELIDSFKNKSLPDTTEIQYKCIKWPNLSTKQYLSGIKNKLGNTTQEINGHETGDKYANEKKESAKNIETKSSKELKNNTEGNTTNVPTCERNSIINHDKYSKNEENNLETLKSMETSNLNGKYHTENVFNNVNEFSYGVTQTSSSSSSEDFDIVNDKSFKCPSNSTYSVQHSQSKTSQVNRNRRKTSCTNYSNKDLDDVKSKSKCKTDSKARKFQSNTFANQSYATHSKVKFTKEYQYSNTYNEWYKNLKIKVKQIELAIYIDELSKL